VDLDPFRPELDQGLTQLQEIQKLASRAPKTAKDESPWLYINDSDVITDANKEGDREDQPRAATIMAPGWAHWSIGDLKADKRVWNDGTFGVYPLPARRQARPGLRRWLEHRHLGSVQEPVRRRELLKIIFSHEYQQMLGKNGLGPANSDDVSSLGTDEFAQP